MKIETRFNPGDEIVILHNSKIANVSVYSIKIEIYKDEVKLSYWFKIDDSFEVRKDHEVFKSKEEFINQL